MSDGDSGPKPAGADDEPTVDLADRLDDIAGGLEDVERVEVGEATEYRVAGRVFAVLEGRTVSYRLEGAVARAAVRTPDCEASSRGAGWVAFTPQNLDRYALDRAEAWLESAWRNTSS